MKFDKCQQLLRSFTFGIVKAGNHIVLVIGFTEFRAGIRTTYVRK